MEQNEIEELERGLAHATGTEHYYRFYLNTLVTDGIQYLMEKANCYWLFTDASSIVINKLNKESFITVELTKKEEGALVEYTDGDGHSLFKQEYEYTDFPLEEIKFYYIDGVFLLPSEY